MKILLFRTHKGDPLCEAISLITRGPYTHAAVSIDGGREIIEAFYPVVRTRTLDADELPGIDVFDVEGIKPEQERAALAYLNSHLGDSYSVTDLFRFLPVFRLALGDDKEAAAKQHHFCSMLAFQALDSAGIECLKRVDAWEVCPNALSWSPRLTPAAALV